MVVYLIWFYELNKEGIFDVDLNLETKLMAVRRDYAALTETKVGHSPSHSHPGQVPPNNHPRTIPPTASSVAASKDGVVRGRVIVSGVPVRGVNVLLAKMGLSGGV